MQRLESLAHLYRQSLTCVKPPDYLPPGGTQNQRFQSVLAIFFRGCRARFHLAADTAEPGRSDGLLPAARPLDAVSLRSRASTGRIARSRHPISTWQKWARSFLPGVPPAMILQCWEFPLNALTSERL